MELFYSVFRRRIQTSSLSGEKRLLLAVFEIAFNDLVNHSSRTDSRSRKRFDEVVDWIKSSDTKWPCSFESICLTLDLNPNYMREGIASYIGNCRMYPLGLDLSARKEIKSTEDEQGSHQHEKTIESPARLIKAFDLTLKEAVKASKTKDNKRIFKIKQSKSILPASQLAAYEARKQRINQRNQGGY